jgi:hypothetical protein
MSNGGKKPIKKIKKGDEIMSFDIEKNKMIVSKIISTAKSMHDNLIEIDFGDKKIVVTDDHPLYGKEGWLSYIPENTRGYKGYENVRPMMIGDEIVFVNKDGTAENKKIVNIRRLNKTEETYTITKLSTGNTFIADGVVAGIEEIKNK